MLVLLIPGVQMGAGTNGGGAGVITPGTQLPLTGAGN